MLTWDGFLFYLVFLGQIFLISYYIPEKLLQRMKYVLETYPPSDFPKLYPKPIEHYKLGHWLFRMLNRCVVVIGFLTLLAIVFVIDHANFADDGYISEFWPALYGMIQFVPLLLLEFTEFNQLKLMRQANPATVRKAELRRRRLFDFVSPVLFGSAVVLMVCAVLLDFYVQDFVFQWKKASTGITIIVTNLLLFAIGTWNLYGRKQDPHQSFKDRSRTISAQLHSMLYVSIAASIFIMSTSADEIYNLDFLDAAMMSLYFQVIAYLSIGHLMKSQKLEDIDFDVYKNDVAVT